MSKELLGLYFSCAVLAILGILNFVSGPFIIGFVVGIIALLAAGSGAAGGYFKSPRFLWFFMCGIILTVTLTLVNLIISLIKTNWFSVAICVLEIVCLAIGFLISWNMRGRSFQWGFIHLGGGDKQETKKQAEPLATVV